MNLIKNLFCSKHKAQQNNIFKKMWRFEVKQKIGKHEIQSYSLTIEKQIIKV